MVGNETDPAGKELRRVVYVVPVELRSDEAGVPAVSYRDFVGREVGDRDRESRLFVEVNPDGSDGRVHHVESDAEVLIEEPASTEDLEVPDE